MKQKPQQPKEKPQHCIISFYSKFMSTFNELVLKNAPVKN